MDFPTKDAIHKAYTSNKDVSTIILKWLNYSWNMLINTI